MCRMQSEYQYFLIIDATLFWNDMKITFKAAEEKEVSMQDTLRIPIEKLLDCVIKSLDALYWCLCSSIWIRKLWAW